MQIPVVEKPLTVGPVSYTHLTGGQQHIVHGGQRKLRRIVGLAQMAQRKLFAALLNEVQNLGSAGPVVQMAAVAGDALL